ncbi:MAG: rhodanese-like domain-containing protein [Luteibaculaceae bacterium]
METNQENYQPKRPMWQNAMGSALIILLTMGLFNFFQGQAQTSAVKNMNGTEFKAAFEADANAVLLDVRTPSEFNSGFIPGAVNIDFYSANFDSEIQKLDKSKTYYVYCRSGARSSGACSKLEAQGLKSYNLSGGIGAYPKK